MPQHLELSAVLYPQICYCQIGISKLLHGCVCLFDMREELNKRALLITLPTQTPGKETHHSN